MNRYNFSGNKKIELPLTKQPARGQIWRHKASGVEFVVDGVHAGGGPSQTPRIWNVHTTTLGNRINTQINESTLICDYERIS